MYLDRGYIKNNNKVPLEEYSWQMFRETVFNRSSRMLFLSYNIWISGDRRGTSKIILQKDASFLRRCLDAFLTTDKTVYVFLQLEYLKHLGAYLGDHADAWIRDLKPCEYLSKVNEEMQDEERRVQRFMIEHESLFHTRSLMYRHLLKEHIAEVFSVEENAFLGVLERKDAVMRTLFFQLFHNAGIEEALVKMCNDFKEYTSQQLNTLYSGSTEEELEQFFEEHEETCAMLHKDFGDHRLFNEAHVKMMQAIVNKNPARLTQYLDRIMRTGRAHDSRIVLVCNLLGYHSGPDTIAEVLRRDMARRYFVDRSFSQEWEKTLLSTLKHRFGYQFTTKMEGMSFDYTSQTLITEYTPAFPETTMRVLTGSYWPSFCSLTEEFNKILLPPIVQQSMEHFEAFFAEHHPARKISWQHHLGTFVLRAFFPRGDRRYDVSCGMLQGLVLMWLATSTGDTSLQILCEITKIPQSLLCPVLHSLVFGPHKLLIKSPMLMTDHKIRDNDTFCLNLDFFSKKRLLQLPVVIVDPPRVQEKIQEDRKYYFEAIVVRIMKARKRMAHKELIKEALGQSNITVESKFIKTIIEKLIEKEYLERASEDNSVYLYVA